MFDKSRYDTIRDDGNLRKSTQSVRLQQSACSVQGRWLTPEGAAVQAWCWWWCWRWWLVQPDTMQGLYFALDFPRLLPLQSLLWVVSCRVPFGVVARDTRRFDGRYFATTVSVRGQWWVRRYQWLGWFDSTLLPVGIHGGERETGDGGVLFKLELNRKIQWKVTPMQWERTFFTRVHSSFGLGDFGRCDWFNKMRRRYQVAFCVADWWTRGNSKWGFEYVKAISCLSWRNVAFGVEFSSQGQTQIIKMFWLKYYCFWYDL